VKKKNAEYVLGKASANGTSQSAGGKKRRANGPQISLAQARKGKTKGARHFNIGEDEAKSLKETPRQAPST